MNLPRSSLLFLSIAYGLLVAPTASAHGLHTVDTAVTAAQQPVSWVVGVMGAALAVFVLIVGGATVLRLRMHRRRRPVSARMNALLTSSLAASAAIALVAFVATQFMP